MSLFGHFNTYNLLYLTLLFIQLVKTNYFMCGIYHGALLVREVKVEKYYTNVQSTCPLLSRHVKGVQTITSPAILVTHSRSYICSLMKRYEYRLP